MKGRFSQFEARMEALVEGSFARLFAGPVHPRDIALQLARALEDSAAAGTPAAAYRVRLHPADRQALLKAHPNLAQRLATDLLALAREADLLLERPPSVSLLADEAQKERQFRVETEAQGQPRSVTQTLAPVRPDHALRAPRAFLIVDGQRTVPLSGAVVALGRRFDNQIVVDDPRVSRAHAQLRLRFGRYVLYDLGSTAGTFVNGQRIVEVVLRPGDVISLGGVPIIYGEDTDLDAARPRPDAAGSTSAGPPVRSDHEPD